MGWIQNLDQHRASNHPRMLAALEKLDKGTAAHVRYDLLEKLRLSDGSAIRIETSYRSWEDQDGLIAAEAAGGADVTDATGGKSFHQWGLADDLIIRRAGYGSFSIDGRVYQMRDPATMEMLGLPAFFASEGIGWLGRHPKLHDVSHFELDIPHPTDRALSGKAWWELSPWKENKLKKYVPWIIAALGAWYFVRKATKGNSAVNLASVRR